MPYCRSPTLPSLLSLAPLPSGPDAPSFGFRAPLPAGKCGESVIVIAAQLDPDEEARRVKTSFLSSEQGVTMHVCVLLCMQVGRGIVDRFTLPLFSNANCFEFVCL